MRRAIGTIQLAIISVNEGTFWLTNVCILSICILMVDRIVRELGTGTFAKAYEVVNLKTNEHCAVKIVRSVPRYSFLPSFNIVIAGMPKWRPKLLWT